MSKQFIVDLKYGNKVSSLFSVKYKHPPKQYKNGFMFTAGLSDRTGEIEATYWGGTDISKLQKIYDSFGVYDVVYISGLVGQFKSKQKIDINEEKGAIRKTDDYDIEDFVGRTEKNIGELILQLSEIIGSISNPHLKALLNSFFDDVDWLEEFKNAPAAMYIHQAYIGGLLEHSLNVAGICKAIWSIYPTLDKDLLLTGAILHDIGKIKEFQITTNIRITEEGMLRGHISLGEEMLLDKIKEIEEGSGRYHPSGSIEAWSSDDETIFPEVLKFKLLHIMLSHHGRGEYGSPKEPQFPEAAAIYYADECDAKVFQYVQIKEEAATEDFRTYSKRLGQIYLR
jgi:uncharacterized domain HDIG